LSDSARGAVPLVCRKRPGVLGHESGKLTSDSLGEPVADEQSLARRGRDQ